MSHRKDTLKRNFWALMSVLAVLTGLTLLFTTVHVNFGEDIVIAEVFGWNWETLLVLAIGIFFSPIITIYLMKKLRILKKG